MENYPSNSHSKPTSDETPVEKVIRGEVSRRKKPLGRRFAETFTGADATSVSEHIVLNVLIPAIKNMVYEAVTQGTAQSLFGSTRGSAAPSGSRPGGSRVAYDRYADQTRPAAGPARMSNRARAVHNFEDLIFDTIQDANEVLDHMYAILEKSDVVSVSDLYRLVDLRPDYTDESFGWFSLRGSRVVPVRGNGFVLDLPRPQPIS